MNISNDGKINNPINNTNYQINIVLAGRREDTQNRDTPCDNKISYEKSLSKRFHSKFWLILENVKTMGLAANYYYSHLVNLNRDLLFVIHRTSFTIHSKVRL